MFTNNKLKALANRIADLLFAASFLCLGERVGCVAALPLAEIIPRGFAELQWLFWMNR